MRTNANTDEGGTVDPLNTQTTTENRPGLNRRPPRYNEVESGHVRNPLNSSDAPVGGQEGARTPPELATTIANISEQGHGARESGVVDAPDVARVPASGGAEVRETEDGTLPAAPRPHLTDEDLRNLLIVCDAASPGPWGVGSFSPTQKFRELPLIEGVAFDLDAPQGPRAVALCGPGGDPQSQLDAFFIATARLAFAVIVEELLTARAALSAVQTGEER
jgi:hypothetical protein